MSAKSFVIALSLAGSAGVGCWLMAGSPEAAHGIAKSTTTTGAGRPASRPGAVRIDRSEPVKPAPATTGKAAAARAQPAQDRDAAKARSQTLTTAELTARAAKVEQEANH